MAPTKQARPVRYSLIGNTLLGLSVKSSDAERERERFYGPL
jgi:hypothetical protein